MQSRTLGFYYRTALNLFKSVYISAPDVYAVIRCEEDSVRTRLFRKDGSPEFNTKAIFYSRNPKSKISIEVRCYTTLYIDKVCK